MLNPVEKQMLLLAEKWSEFAKKKDKNVLAWAVPDSSTRLVHCFFETQKQESQYSTGDLFIVLDVPFENSIQYSRDIKKTLIGMYAASVGDLEAEGINPDWDFKAKDTAHTATGAISAFNSFGSNFHQHLQNLVIVLAPKLVSKPQYFEDWIKRALNVGLPMRLKLLVMDSIDNPQFKSLDENKNKRIDRNNVQLDAWNVALKTFAQEPALNPSAVYRNLMMGVMALMGKGDANSVRLKAKDALSFARKQGWKDQEVSLRLMVAGAYLKEQKHRQSALVYESALEFNQRELKGMPLQPKLALQCLFGSGATHLASGDLGKAIDAYRKGAKIAAENDDPIQAIESDRMAGFCYQRNGELEKGLKHSLSAFKRCEALPEDKRASTTGSVAAMDMLRALDSEKSEAILNEKIQSLAAQDKLYSQAEKSAASLEGQHEVAKENQILSILEDHKKKHLQTADENVAKIVASADIRFQKVFHKGKEVFGVAWPLEDPLALPVSEEQILSAVEQTQ